MGGGFSVATGVGGAAAGNGTTPGIGGVGGAVTLTSGAGGAGTANSSTGGVGGAVAITAGAGGAGGTTNGNGGAGGAVTIGSGASGTPIGSGTGGAKGALTFQQAGSTVANWGSLGGLLLESGAATQGVTIIGGRDTSGNEALGGAVLRGANQTGTGGSTSVAGSVLMEGGTNAATNTSSQAGSVEVLAGASNSSTIGLPGLLVLAATYVRGATSTQWNLQCESASMTVVDCGASVVNWIGVAESVGATSGTTSVQVCVVGSQCPINSGNTAVLGHTVCVGGSLHPAEVLDSGGSSACTPAGSTVGVVMAVTGAWTLPDGTSFTASSSLPLVQLVHF